MVEEALAEGKRRGGGGTGTENAGQLQVVVLSVRPLLAFCPLAMFFSFSFCFFALLFLFFFAASCSSFAVQDEWAFE